MLRPTSFHHYSRLQLTIQLFVWVGFYCSFVTWTNGFQVTMARHSRCWENQLVHFSVTRPQQRPKSPSVLWSSSEGGDDDRVFPDSLIGALDLVPLLNAVARHTATRRGHQALLSLVKEDQVTLTNNFVGHTLTQQSSSRRQRAEMALFPRPVATTNNHHSKQPKRNHKEGVSLVHIATSAEEARLEYELVEAATMALSPHRHAWNITFPPIYGTDSSPTDTTTIADTDDDEWLTLPADAWSLEHILQAEQVLNTLLQTKKWANHDETQTWMYGVSQIGALIDPDHVLPAILEEISGQVEIVRFQTLSSSISHSAVRTLQ